VTDRTALIVGRTSGIGLATARRLQALGTTVHIAGRSKERLDDIAAFDPALYGHQADGTSGEQIAALAEAIGPIDWLIITLAGSEGAGPIADLDLGMLRRAFDAKFWGHITTIQAVLPHLAPTGSITLVGAITARAAMPGQRRLTRLRGHPQDLRDRAAGHDDIRNPL
jgi:NAD(P)-dependent dehydrogenase (short-subunit alcohol dehydrogenase family)